jgi:TPR repeat protein
MGFFRTVSAGVALALSIVAPVMAASLEDAVAAYRKADYATAFQVYHVLADQGLAVAQFNLGLMYANGLGVSKDETEAMKWYRLAADQGRADAQYQLGHLFYQQNNFAEAVKWFRLAADQGRPDAQSNLGVMYAEGEGVPRDDVQALMWFTLAADRNHKDAIENRDNAASTMTAAQIAAAKKLAREWKPASPSPLVR